MNRIDIVRTFLILGLTASALCAAEKKDSNPLEYTSGQICEMTREANTVEQYSALADYYARRQRLFAHKGLEEMHLWAMRSSTHTSLSEKWPRPVDSARNLHDYYQYEANKAATLQAKYSRLADQAAK